MICVYTVANPRGGPESPRERGEDLVPSPFTGRVRAFKGRVFKISKIVEKILKCFTWFGCFRIFKSAEMVKKLPNTKSLPLKGGLGWGKNICARGLLAKSGIHKTSRYAGNSESK
jgi:hypothetical protein